MKYLAVVLLLTACASTIHLVPGESRIEDVRRELGEPATIYREADGSAHLAYPTGSIGYWTRMVHVGADGRVLGIERNVLDGEHFARIRPGMTPDQVVRVLGPPAPERTVYYAARDELAWDWHYCDAWNAAAYFSVLFDATRKTVRSTLSVREHCLDGDCGCAQ